MAVPSDLRLDSHTRLRRKTSAELLRDQNLTPAERELVVKPHLPPLPDSSSTKKTPKDNGANPSRPFNFNLSESLRAQIHFLAYFAITVIFGICVRLRQAYHAVIDRVLAILYYHHRTPELIQRDVKGLSQIPEHLSCVLKLKREEDAVDVLSDDVAELVAWSSCAGIPMLSIYERTGSLKLHIPSLHRFIVQKLSSYYGPPAQQPTVYLYAPHHPIYCPDIISPEAKSNKNNITVLLLSATDGRETLVDLTKTLAEMAQHGKISPEDISVKLVDAELSEIMSPAPMNENGFDTPLPNGISDKITTNNQDPSRPALASVTNTVQTETAAPHGDSETIVTEQIKPISNASTMPYVKPEPDLLIVFGPYLKLDGYPPWPIRLTEIYCTGHRGDLATGGGGETVEYQKFLKGLWRYAKAEMRFGK